MATALQKSRITNLYRTSLKQLLSWVVSREVWYTEAEKIRKEFDANANIDDPHEIERLLQKGEARLREFAHPDPYIVPYRPGGSLFARNPPMPEEMSIQLDFTREK